MTPQPPQPPESVFLSDEAWRSLQLLTEAYKYTGKAAHHGVGSFLAATFSANPLSTDWRDTRPPQLTKYDRYRAADYLPPQWFEDNAINAGASAMVAADAAGRERPTRSNAGRRLLAHRHWRAILPRLLELAEAFNIQHPHPRYYTHPSLKANATAVLEAIGLGHLSQRNHTPLCTKPAATHQTKRGGRISDARTTRNQQRARARAKPEHTYNW